MNEEEILKKTKIPQWLITVYSNFGEKLYL